MAHSSTLSRPQSPASAAAPQSNHVAHADAFTSETRASSGPTASRIPLASFSGARALDTELFMAPDRRVLSTQADALLAHIGAFVREHLVLLSSRQAQALGRLQLAVMQTHMAGQHGRISQEQALQQLESHTRQFEQQYEQLYTHHLPRIVPWPTLPAGPATIACLRLKASILRSLQTMALAEARAHDTQGPAESMQLCASLLSPRLTLAFVYDATRLLFITATSIGCCDAWFLNVRLAPLFEAMHRIDADLEDLFVRRSLMPPQSPAREQSLCVSEPMPLDKQLIQFAETLMVLSERAQQRPDPMGFWAMTCDSFQRLLYVIRMAQTSNEHTAALRQTLVETTTQMHQLLAWFDVPSAALPRAAPSA